MNWFWTATALSAAVTITYFLFESFRELLLDVVSDWLDWIVPGTFVAVGVISLVCAAGTSKTVEIAGQPMAPGAVIPTGRPGGRVDQLDGASLDTPSNTEPERQAGLRVVIIQAAAPGTDSFSPTTAAAIETEFEKQFRTAGIRLLADKNLRAQLIMELQKYQKGRALYEPATLTQVEFGHFHGATHGVFWSVTQQGAASTLECRLVRLRTSEVVTTTSTPLRDDPSLAASVQEAAVSLLAEIAEVTFVTPRNESVCGRKITVEGRITYLPSNWTLWITLVPDGLSNHFPQRAATMQRNGSLTAPEVYLGEDKVAGSQKFFVYAVMADPQTSAQIQAYLQHPDSVGLDIANWPKHQCKIIGRVVVTSSQGRVAGCAGVRNEKS